MPLADSAVLKWWQSNRIILISVETFLSMSDAASWVENSRLQWKTIKSKRNTDKMGQI